MKNYTVKVPYQGYSRGDAIYIVEAESEEEAVKNVEGEGYCDYLNPTRDDTECDFSQAEIDE